LSLFDTPQSAAGSFIGPAGIGEDFVRISKFGLLRLPIEKFISGFFAKSEGLKGGP